MLLKNSELPLWKMPNVVEREIRGRVKRSVSFPRKIGVRAMSTPRVMLTDVARAAKRMSSRRYAKKNQSRMMFSTATEMFIHILKLALPQMRR